MSASVFTLCLLAYLFLVLGRQRWDLTTIFFKFFSVGLVLELFVNVGYFVKIGDFALSPSYFIFILLFMTSMWLLAKQQIAAPLYRMAAVLLGCMFFGYVHLLINPVETPVISYYKNWDFDYYKFNFDQASVFLVQARMPILLAMYVPIYLSALGAKRKVFVKRIGDAVLVALCVMYAFLAVEFVLKNQFHSNVLTGLVNAFFGDSTSYIDRLLLRGQYYALQGLCREPSQMAKSLFVATTVFLLVPKYGKRTDRLITVLSCAFLFLTRSLIGFASIAIIIFVYLSVNGVRFWKVVALGIVGLGAVVLVAGDGLDYYLERIWQSLAFLRDRPENWREYILQPRLISIMETLRLGSQRPLFGVGVGLTYAHSFIATGFASLGFIGMSVWLWMHFSRSRLRGPSRLYVFCAMLVFWLINGYLGELYSLGSLAIALAYNEDFDRVSISTS